MTLAEAVYHAIQPAHLLRDIFHMLPNQMVHSRVVEDWEAPWISEGNQMRFSREEFNVQDLEQGDLLPRDTGLVYAIAQGGV
jgi:hypothetical protein